MNKLEDILISKVRVKMLVLFFTNAEEMYYVRQLTRLINEEINAVRRELDRLIDTGMLKSEERGNRLYYFLNKQYLYYQDFMQIVAKSSGLGDQIRKKRRKLGKLDYVMFSVKFVSGIQPSRDEVDILVVGEVVLPELQTLIKARETDLGREINYAVFSKEEFEFRKTRRDPFIMDILYGSRIMIIGSEIEFSHRDTPGLNS
jgi:DNA-binding transcriptional ArsR family regulator